MPPVVGQAQPPREDDPSSDEDSDGDDEAVENDAVLNQVEEENVVNLAHLQWEEQQVTPMPPLDTLLHLMECRLVHNLHLEVVISLGQKP